MRLFVLNTTTKDESECFSAHLRLIRLPLLTMGHCVVSGKKKIATAVNLSLLSEIDVSSTLSKFLVATESSGGRGATPAGGRLWKFVPLFKT